MCYIGSSIDQGLLFFMGMDEKVTNVFSDLVVKSCHMEYLKVFATNVLGEMNAGASNGLFHEK